MHQASTGHARANTGSTQRLIDPTIVVHNGRVVKRTGDGAIVEFRRAVDAVRCAIEIKTQWWKATPETTATSWRWRQYRCAIGRDRDARSQSARAAYRYVKGRLDLKVTEMLRPIAMITLISAMPFEWLSACVSS
jgi:hypothetical protein